MDWVIDILSSYGYWGMLLAAFLAGSFFPFSSEAVMVGLMAAGLDPWLLTAYGTVGNVLGSLVNYCIGRLGKTEWFEKYLHVKPEHMDKARRFMRGRGAWMGFFAFIPILGSAITILLGLMRANVFVTFISITTGKLLRYILLIYGAFLVNWLLHLLAGL
jgi:membrane protein YqaA with SNARE-associated domain